MTDAHSASLQNLCASAGEPAMSSKASNPVHRRIDFSAKRLLFTGNAAVQELTIRARTQESEVDRSVGFAPVARPDARILILGSLPGQRSIQARQYYAHRQNTFWRIMRDLLGADGSYQRRCDTLCAHRIALWDVLAQSVRRGSMDADIELGTAEVNDFGGFFRAHHDIEMIAFNGQKAAQMFRRFVAQSGIDIPGEQLTMPSTSPAYAAMPYSRKLEIWRSVVIAL